MPRLVSALRLLLLALTIGAAAGGIALLRQDPVQMAGAPLLLAALLAFVGLVGWSARRPASGLGLGGWAAEIWARGWQERLRYLPIVAGALLTIVLMVVAEEPALMPAGLLLIWGVSGACLVGGAWLIDRQPAFDAVALAEPWERWEIPALTLLTLLAWAARASQIATLPAPIHGDEGEMGMAARAVLSGEMVDPFDTAWLSHPTIWFFIQALGLRALGDDIGGLRSVSAIVGTLAIPACYLFARPRYGTPIALAATIMLAAFPVHIHFSRIGLNNIVDPLMALLMLAALFHGWRTGALASFAAAGWLLGSAQQFYFGSRLLVLICAGLLAHQLLLNRALLARRWAGMLLLAFSAIAGIGPLLRHYLERPDTLMARVVDVGLFQNNYIPEQIAAGVTFPQIMAGQIWRGFGAYVAVPDTGLFYASEYGILTPLAGALCACGLGAALWRWRRPEQFVLLLIFVGTAVFGGVLLSDAPQTPRYVLATPALCILIALGAQQIIQIASASLGVSQRPAAALLLAASLWLAGAGIGEYFIDYSPKQRYAATRDITAVAAYLRALPPGSQVRFMGAPLTFYEHGTLRFNAPGVPGSDILEPIADAAQVPDNEGGRGVVYVALAPRIAELELVRMRYPGGHMRTFRDPVDAGASLFGAYEVP